MRSRAAVLCAAALLAAASASAAKRRATQPRFVPVEVTLRYEPPAEVPEGPPGAKLVERGKQPRTFVAPARLAGERTIVVYFKGVRAGRVYDLVYGAAGAERAVGAVDLRYARKAVSLAFIVR